MFYEQPPGQTPGSLSAYEPQGPPSREYSPGRAVLTGHLVVTLPAFIIMFGTVFGIIATMGNSGRFLSLVAGAVLVRVWCWLALPRWQRWAAANSAPFWELQTLARRTGLTVPTPYDPDDPRVQSYKKRVLVPGSAVLTYVVFLLLIGYTPVANTFREPTGLQAHLDKAHQYAKDGDYPHAIAEYNQALKIQSNCWCVYNGRGSAYYEEGEYELAIDDFTQAIKMRPDDGVIYSNRGNVYADKDEPEKAIADYTKAISLEPDDSTVYYNRGYEYTWTENYSSAVSDFTEAIKLNPKYAESYYGRGFAYYHLDKYDQAIADLNRDAEMRPNHARTYLTRGEAYSMKGDRSKAVDDFKKALNMGADTDVADEARSRLKDLEAK